jgi:hypothetical protein
VLKVIDPRTNGIVLCTDVSYLALGVILMQAGRIIAYEYGKLNIVKLNYPNHENELLVVIHALKIWNYYLFGKPFTIEIDHESMKYLTTQPNLRRK